MRTARFQLLDTHLWIWIDDPDVEDRSDFYPILRQWMEGFIEGYPFILEDTLDDPWMQQHAQTYPGPIAFVRTKRQQYALVGSTDRQLLRDHQKEYGLSWIGGLRVSAYAHPDHVQEQVRAWDGQSIETLDRFIRLQLFTLITGGDAQGLQVRPGQRTLVELLAKAEQIASALGYDWGPVL